MLNESLICFADQFGASRAFGMLKAALGDFDEFVQECAEDVVVLAHCHHWRCKMVDSRMGKLIYVNTGTWIDPVEEVRPSSGSLVNEHRGLSLMLSLPLFTKVLSQHHQLRSRGNFRVPYTRN